MVTMVTEKLIEEILTLTEIALEEKPNHLGSEARVTVECAPVGWLAKVTYPVRCRTLRRTSFSSAVHALGSGDTLAEALENLANSCGEKAAAAGANL